MNRLAFVVFGLVGIAVTCAAVEGAVTIERCDHGATIKIDGKPFCDYWTKSGNKPIVWPILGPTGKPMTRAYPMAKGVNEKEDHKHHRSLWFTHGDVNGVNFWEDGRSARIVQQRILRLEDVMDIVEAGSDKPGLYIETKSARRFPGVEKQLVEILTARGWIRPLPRGVSESPQAEGARVPARVIFQSFEADSLARLKELAPQVPATLLIDEAMMRKEGWDGILRSAKQVAVGIGTWGYRWSRDPGWSVKDAPDRYLTVWPWYTGQAHRAGLLVHPWTIDDRWEMWMVSLFGADGFFTNRPDLALLFYGRADHIELQPIWERIGY